MAVTPRGRPARTAYRVVERLERPPESCLIEAKLETGRTHQIRVHMAAIGHPVGGDDRYGDRSQTMPIVAGADPSLESGPALSARAPAHFGSPSRGARVMDFATARRPGGGPRRSGEGRVSGRSVSSFELCQLTELLHRPRLCLPCPSNTDPEPARGGLQRSRCVAVEPEADPYDLALEPVECVYCLPDPVEDHGALDLLLEGVVVDPDEVTERSIPVASSRLVEAGNHPRHLGKCR